MKTEINCLCERLPGFVSPKGEFVEREVKGIILKRKGHVPGRTDRSLIMRTAGGATTDRWQCLSGWGGICLPVQLAQQCQ